MELLTMNPRLVINTARCTRSSSRTSRRWEWILLCVLSLLQGTLAKVSASLPIDLPSDQRYAYVTLLYSDDFALGVRALGQSLRATQNEKRQNIDHVVLITPHVGKEMEEWLQADGWKVKRVEAAQNPNDKYIKRLHGVYTKLEIFRLIEYHRVVYLDADTTILENVDELFLCGPFCAVMRHSELINTGVIVAEPSHPLYNDLKAKAKKGLYSYTGGDQGFLNSYYSDYAACPYFEPMKQIGLGSDGSKCRRLPTRYNGDWPFVMLNGMAMVSTKNHMQEEFEEFRRSRIIHYTAGPFKPWDWYSFVFFPFTHHWTRAAAELPQTPRDKQRFQKEVVLMVLGGAYFMLWFLVVLHGGAKQYGSAVVSRQSKAGCCVNPIKVIFSLLRQQMTPRHTTRAADHKSWTRDPLSKGSLLMHLIVGYVCFSVAFGTGFLVVPSHTHQPIIGFSICLLWSFGLFFSLYSLYLYRWYLLGEAHSTTKSPKSSDVDLEHNRLLRPKVNGRWAPQSSTFSTSRMESFTHAMGMLAFVVWFVLIRIHSRPLSLAEVMPPWIGLFCMVTLGLTVAFYRLPFLWYQEGLSA